MADNLEIAKRLGYIQEKNHRNAVVHISEVGKMLKRLIDSAKSKS